MDRVPAVVDVGVVYFAVQDESTPGQSLRHAPGERPEVRGIVLVGNSKFSEKMQYCSIFVKTTWNEFPKRLVIWMYLQLTGLSCEACGCGSSGTVPLLLTILDFSVRFHGVSVIYVPTA
jgi:hypothetical protein